MKVRSAEVNYPKILGLKMMESGFESIVPDPKIIVFQLHCTN